MLQGLHTARPHARVRVEDTEGSCWCDVNAERGFKQVANLPFLTSMVLCVWSDTATKSGWVSHLTALRELSHLHFAQANVKHPNDTALLQGLSQLTSLTSLSVGLMDNGVRPEDLAGLRHCPLLKSLSVHNLRPERRPLGVNAGFAHRAGAAAQPGGGVAQGALPPRQQEAAGRQQLAAPLLQPQGQPQHALQAQLQAQLPVHLQQQVQQLLGNQRPHYEPPQPQQVQQEEGDAAAGADAAGGGEGNGSNRGGLLAGMRGVLGRLLQAPRPSLEALPTLTHLSIHICAPKPLPLAALAPNLLSLSLGAMQCTSTTLIQGHLHSLKGLTKLVSLELKMLIVPLSITSKPDMMPTEPLPGTEAVAELVSLERFVFNGWHHTGPQLLALLRAARQLQRLQELRFESCGPQRRLGTLRSRLLAHSLLPRSAFGSHASRPGAEPSQLFRAAKGLAAPGPATAAAAAACGGNSGAASSRGSSLDGDAAHPFPASAYSASARTTPIARMPPTAFTAYSMQVSGLSTATGISGSGPDTTGDYRPHSGVVAGSGGGGSLGAADRLGGGIQEEEEKGRASLSSLHACANSVANASTVSSDTHTHFQQRLHGHHDHHYACCSPEAGYQAHGQTHACSSAHGHAGIGGSSKGATQSGGGGGGKASLRASLWSLLAGATGALRLPEVTHITLAGGTDTRLMPQLLSALRLPSLQRLEFLGVSGLSVSRLRQALHMAAASVAPHEHAHAPTPSAATHHPHLHLSPQDTPQACSMPNATSSTLGSSQTACSPKGAEAASCGGSGAHASTPGAPLTGFRSLVVRRCGGVLLEHLTEARRLSGPRLSAIELDYEPCGCGCCACPDCCAAATAGCEKRAIEAIAVRLQASSLAAAAVSAPAVDC